MGKSYGPCVSKEKCIEIITHKVRAHIPEDMRDEYERAVNRLRYEFAKIDGAKPGYIKGNENNMTIGNAGIAEPESGKLWRIIARTAVIKLCGMESDA